MTGLSSFVGLYAISTQTIFIALPQPSTQEKNTRDDSDMKEKATS